MATASMLNLSPSVTSAQHKLSSIQRSERCTGLKVSARPIRQAQSLCTRAVTKGETEGSEPGRLVQDALEFSKSQTSQVPARAPHQEQRQQEERQAGDLLGGKYQVVELLAKGKSGLVYKAERPGGGYVAVKTLSLRSMADWKQLELFEKEARAMRKLSHSGIPAYIDYFEVDSDGDRGYFLVQELIEGKSLAQMVEAGWKPSKQEVERIASQLLSTLAYLQKQQVVHRDIKPENIILENGKPGGRILLTDFGGAQQSPSDSSEEVEDLDLDMGTMVGTYGYMAPEQLRGAAQPASDLFALGGTLLYLLSGEEPSSFPQRRLKIDFSRISTGSKLQALLEGLLEPTWEDRLTVKQAQAVLTGQSSPQQAKRAEQARPRPTFGDWGWSTSQDADARSSSSSRRAQDQDEEQQEGTEPQGFGLNPVLLALAAAYVLPGPLAPLVALTLPFWLGGRKQSRRSRQRRQPASSSQGSRSDEGTREGEGSEWMSGTQQRLQSGFGFSDSPARDVRGEDRFVNAEMTEEEQEVRRQRRQQQQMAAFQQQQMLFNMLRVMGGGVMGGGMMRRGRFRRSYGMRGGFGGPFMF